MTLPDYYRCCTRCYFRTDCWMQIHHAVLRLANYECQLRLLCNGAPALQVHHPNYRNIGREDPRDLIACCAACHAFLHDRPIPKSSNNDNKPRSAQLMLDIFAGKEDEEAA